jgi:hypothetical protein
MMFEELTRRGLDGSLAIDIGSVLWGRRTVGLAHVPTRRLNDFIDVIKGSGLQAAVSRRLTPSLDDTTGQFSLAACGGVTDNQMCEVWFAADLLDSETVQSFVMAPGKNLGYPKCCTEAYARESGFTKLYKNYMLEGGKRSWRLNRFASLFEDSRLTLDYLPCSLSCRASAKMAGGYVGFLEAVLGRSELTRRICLNQMTYGLIGGALVRLSKFVGDECGNLVVEAEDVVKSVTRLDVGLQSDTFGIFSFDSTSADVKLGKKVFVRSQHRVWEFQIQCL